MLTRTGWLANDSQMGDFISGVIAHDGIAANADAKTATAAGEYLLKKGA